MAHFGPESKIRARPDRLSCHGDGPGPGTVDGSCQPGHGEEQAVPCLGRAKFAVLWAGQRATGCLDNYNPVRVEIKRFSLNPITSNICTHGVLNKI